MIDLKICIPSKDGRTIFKGHMGDSPFFEIYEVDENGKNVFVEKRENPPFEEKGHGNQRKMEHILRIVGDCEVFVGAMLSPNFLNLRKNTHVQPVVSKFERIDETLKAIQGHVKTLSSLVEKRKKGERPEKIPVFSSDGVTTVE